MRLTGIVTFEEEGLDRARFAQHALQDQQQGHEVPAANPSMHQRGEPIAFARGVEVAHEAGRMRAHHREQRLDRLQHAGHAAEGEPCRTEADDLAILWRAETPDDVDWIGGRRHMVEGLVEAVESLGGRHVMIIVRGKPGASP